MVGDSFAKITNTKVSSKLCQTSEIELFPQVVTGFRGELRILSNIYDGAFCKNTQKRKALHYFCKKSSILDVWKGYEYASELAFKVKDVLFLNQFKYQG